MKPQPVSVYDSAMREEHIEQRAAERSQNGHFLPAETHERVRQMRVRTIKLLEELRQRHQETLDKMDNVRQVLRKAS